MLYCPGSRLELLSAFGVTMECHDSSVFLIRKLSLSISEALLKSMEWSWDHAWFAILEPSVPCFYISYVFFSSGVKCSTSITNITPRTVGARNFVNNVGL